MANVRTPDDNDLTRIIIGLQDRIERLERSPRIISTSIDSGQLTLKDTTGFVQAILDGSGIRLWNDDFDVLQSVQTLAKNLSVNLKMQAGSYTLLPTDGVVVFTSGTFATLPDPALQAPGLALIVKNVNSSNLTVVTNGTGSIDGTTSKVLSQWQFARFMSTGTDWVTI